MKNNSEIVNNTMCKSCLREHKEMTGYEPIDCAFKAFDNEYCDEAQTLADYIADLQSQLDQQKAMWNELKEWLVRVNQVYINDGFCDCAGAICEVIDKVQELEQGEKNVKD